ncbi:hypothetical protein FSHL1_000348 [Fusarium sambucinum]
MPRAPIEIEEAKPTVRLRNQDGGYKETQEVDVFKASGGKPKDLLDDERWLHGQYGNTTQPFWTEISLGNTLLAHYNLWFPTPSGSDTIRIVPPRHRVFQLIARACESERSKLGDHAKETREHLGMSGSKRITMNSDIRGIYVGISATTCLPIVLRQSEHWEESSLNNDDVNELHDLRVDLCERTHAKDIIWTENMLIPGNIAHLKSAIAGKLYGQEKRRFLRIMKRENNLLEAGLNPAGVAKTLPSSEVTERRPSVRRLTHDGQEYDAIHFKLRWPPMAALEFPREMIHAMEDFLTSNPEDNVPINIALAATIIYIDLADEGWLSEGFMGDHNNQLTIRPPPLGQFILYFPHMLRFVEVKHLTEFIHPGRFATGQYTKDNKSSDSVFNIDSNLIDLKKMRLWYSQIRSRYPKVSKSYRFRLIPASMPGTHMVFPRHCTNAERPSFDLFRMCLLNDIRTLGLPSYHHSLAHDNDQRLFRHIAGPDSLFSKHTNLAAGFSFHIYGLTGGDYWRPKPDTYYMALTGQAKTIDVVFPDVSSDYYTDNKAISEFVERHFDDVAYYTEDHEYCEYNSEDDREKRSARAKELYRVVTYLKIPVNRLWQCPNTGCPAWDGMETQLRQLKEQGILESITTNDEYVPVKDEPADDEPERAAKRPRLSEPTSTFSATSKERIEILMSSATSLSREWDALALYLEGEPTIQEAKRLLSQVHPFILRLEELPCTVSDDGNNYEGDLESILRLAYKAVGLDPQLTLTRQKRKWASQFSGFHQFGQPIERAVEDFIALGPLKDGYRYALPSIVTLANSPLVQDQINLYNEINALFEDETAKS